ncbi:hypothetical protein E2F50_22315 [Rhizobium deserti]|uniref:Uncharacterized protein n=2 Tax=Rhizobium deserti TaxID=2547961 RepID=A0A4V3AN66_9HYPH|nr:hypothetical protein E2F50_22315 [Rhizobium deserti]
MVIDLNEIGSGGSSASPQQPAPSNLPAAIRIVDDPGCGCSGSEDSEINLDGNLSTFDAGVFAGGENSYADLIVDVFALEDEMSTITVLIDAGLS